MRQRIPAADVREGDLEALPLADNTFDAVTAVNSLFYAADMEAAVRAVYADADRAHTRPDGSIRYENVFLWVAGERP